MPHQASKPIIVFSFANSAKAHLPLLKEESKQLLKYLSSFHDEDTLEVHREESTTVEELSNIFIRFDRRICIFHYAGHAGGEGLQLEEGDAHAAGLASLISRQKEQLAFVFLNGCSTVGQVDRLLTLGVKAVIATSVPVGDTKAKEFAGWFYQALTGVQQTHTLESAFRHAAATLQTKYENENGEKPIIEYRSIKLPQDENASIPWGLYINKDFPEIKDWRLADAMENPFLGLPPLPESIGLPKKPFKGLDYFAHDDARIFFGRGAWIQDLFFRVTEKGTDPILLLCGQSGVGKSSLLHAGLWPRLEAAGWEIRYCRKDHLDYLNKHIPEISADNQKNALWVFDQFEELITLHPYQSTEYLIEFIQKLDEFFSLIMNSSDKILLSFRKEYVAEIEAELDKQESLINVYKRIYLEPMEKSGVIEVVKGLTFTGLHKKKYGLTVTDGLPEQIAHDITQDKQSNIAPALQILMTKMWEEATKISNNAPEFRKTLYEQLQRQGLSLEDHLKKVLEELESSPEDFKQGWADSGLVLDFLNFFVTPKLTAAERSLEAPEKGNRNPKEKYVKEVYSHIKQLPQLIRFLQDKFLITENIEDGNLDQIKKYRLSHDALGPIIRSKFDTSGQPGQQAWRIVNAKGVYVLEQPETRRFSESDIEVIQKGREGMPVLRKQLNEKIDIDAEFYLTRRKNDFGLASSAAKRDIEDLEHEKALKNLQSALATGLRLKEVCEKAVELPYPLAFLKSKAKFGEAIQLILSLPGEADSHWKMLADSVKSLPEENLFREMEEWLQTRDEALYNRMQERFFPNLVNIPGGTFEMGAKDRYRSYPQENPAHSVTVSPFKMADTPVTCWQYGLYCLDTGRPSPLDSGFGRGDLPVINVNWYEAIAFTNWLSDQMDLSKVYRLGNIPLAPIELSELIDDWDGLVDWEADGFRLPTEAEWEFAASAKIETNFLGKTTIKKWRFGNGKDIACPDEMNFDASHINNKQAIELGWMREIRKDGFRAATTPVKEFKNCNKNPFQLHDMSGNVYEWCWDRFDGNLGQPDNYYEECRQLGTVSDPRGTKTGVYRAVRGGSWNYDANNCRCSFRLRNLPINHSSYIGFRVARRL